MGLNRIVTVNVISKYNLGSQEMILHTKTSRAAEWRQCVKTIISLIAVQICGERKLEIDANIDTYMWFHGLRFLVWILVITNQKQKKRKTKL